MIKIDKDGLRISGKGSELVNELANILNALMEKGIVTNSDLHEIVDLVSNENNKPVDYQKIAYDLLTDSVNILGKDTAALMLNALFKKYEK